MRIVPGLAEPGGQPLDLLRRELVFAFLGDLVPLGGIDAGAVGEVLLEETMRTNDPQCVYAAGLGQSGADPGGFREPERREPGQQLIRLTATNLQRAGEGVSKHGRAFGALMVEVLHRVLDPHPLRESPQSGDAREDTAPWPDHHEGERAEGGEYEKSEERIYHRHSKS